MLKNREKVTISLPPDLNLWIEEQAKNEYTFKGRLIEKAIQEYKIKIARFGSCNLNE